MYYLKQVSEKTIHYNVLTPDTTHTCTVTYQLYILDCSYKVLESNNDNIYKMETIAIINHVQLPCLIMAKTKYFFATKTELGEISDKVTN